MDGARENAVAVFWRDDGAVAAKIKAATLKSVPIFLYGNDAWIVLDSFFLSVLQSLPPIPEYQELCSVRWVQATLAPISNKQVRGNATKGKSRA